MKYLLFFAVVTMGVLACSKNERPSNVDIRGRWYVDQVKDKASGQIIPNSLPGDSIILYFENDTSYSGKTHRNIYAGKYRFDGSQWLVINFPLSYLLPEDAFGDAYLYMLRACYPGYTSCVTGTSTSRVEVSNGVMKIENAGKYVGWLKKL